jgi:hypothetical protein
MIVAAGIGCSRLCDKSASPAALLILSIVIGRAPAKV